MLIEEFRVMDSQEVSALIKRSIMERDNSHYTKENLDSIVKHYSPTNICSFLGRRKIFIGREKDKIIGTGSLERNEISAVFIDPDYQGLGIGSKFMGLLENLARDKEYKTVELVAVLSAVQFYKRRGYEVIREKIHPEWGKGILMQKTI